MKWRLAWLFLSVVAVGGMILYQLGYFDSSAPGFTIGKDTTYVTGPVDADGLIDYETALNQKLSEGVTPENNANVLLWKAFGPHPEGSNLPADYFRWLGIEPPPEGGDYFIDLSRFLNEQLKIVDPDSTQTILAEQGAATDRAWTTGDHPQIADWLKANEKPLGVVIEATKRTRYFNPLLARDKQNRATGLFSALLPTVQECRAVGAALVARALLRLGEGRFSEGWQDLLAGHRLARLLVGRGTMIEGLVGIALDRIATRADLAFLDTGLTAAHLRQCLQDLRHLPPMLSMAETVSTSDRFLFLDAVMMTHRHGRAYIDSFLNEKTDLPGRASKRFLSKIDWNAALRNGNRLYDRMAAAMRIRDRACREHEFDLIEDEINTLRESCEKSRGAGDSLFGSDHSGRFQEHRFGDVLLVVLTPSVRKIQDAYDQAEQVRRNVEVAFALAAYRADHDRYPSKLSDLSPAYLAKVPGDLYSGRDLIYHLSPKGYQLHSIGVNGIDEDGRALEDMPPGDDLGIRMHLP
jgi:hypothetical protein